MITFVIDDLDEYTFLYTADGFEGQPIACSEGDLQWVEKEKIGALPLWAGDQIFFRLLEERQDVFSLKLTYIHDVLDSRRGGRKAAGAVMNRRAAPKEACPWNRW